MEAWWVIPAFAVGSACGSFAGLLYERSCHAESPCSPPSFCRSCGRRLTIPELVPVLSWLLLRGRCRGCRAPIPPIGFFLELGLGLFAGTLVLAGSTPLRAASLFLLVAGTLVISLVDLRCRLVPVAPVRVIAALGLALQLAGEGPQALLDGVAGAALGYAVFAGIHLLRPDGMGLGDAEVAAMHGAFLGGALSAVAILAGTIAGGLVGAVLLAGGRAGRKTRLAFVPFLAAGAVFALVCGRTILDLYGL